MPDVRDGVGSWYLVESLFMSSGTRKVTIMKLSTQNCILANPIVGVYALAETDSRAPTCANNLCYINCGV